MEKSKELLESFEMLKTACGVALADSNVSENNLAGLLSSQDLTAEQKDIISKAISSMRITNKLITDCLGSMGMLTEITSRVSELTEGIQELTKEELTK